MKIIEKKNVFSGYSKINQLTVLNEAEGITFKREVLERGSSVTLLVYDSIHQKVLLTHEFRAGQYKEVRESTGLVAGMIDNNEAPEVCASRELLEEAGLTVPASNIKLLRSSYTSPGITDEISHMCYVDTDLSDVDIERRYGVLGEAESIRLSLVAISELPDLLESTMLSASAALLIGYLANGII